MYFTETEQVSTYHLILQLAVRAWKEENKGESLKLRIQMSV